MKTCITELCAGRLVPPRAMALSAEELKSDHDHQADYESESQNPSTVSGFKVLDSHAWTGVVVEVVFIRLQPRRLIFSQLLLLRRLRV